MPLEHIAANDADKRISHALQLLRANPRLRLRELAQVFDMSPSRLRHVFKRDVGVSIGEFMQELRLERAKELLQQTYRSQKEIRHDVGIPDAANFSRQFNRRFGMTPSACRRQKTTAFTNK
jgi:AraC family transcriptional regulator, arabinose operon regulatory protein